MLRLITLDSQIVILETTIETFIPAREYTFFKSMFLYKKQPVVNYKRKLEKRPVPVRHFEAKVCTC